MLEYVCFDDEYLRRLRSGDASTEQHFTTYFGKLIQLKLGTRVPSRDHLEDLRQEIFLRVLKVVRTDGLRASSKFGAFVAAVVNNVYREFARERAKHNDAEVPDVLDDSPSADSSLISAERKRLVRVVLAELSDKDRLVLKLVFYEGLDRAEVCRRTGLTPEQLRLVVHRARARLKKKLSWMQ